MNNIFKQTFLESGQTYRELSEKMGSTVANTHTWVNRPGRALKETILKLSTALGISEESAVSCWKFHRIENYKKRL